MAIADQKQELPHESGSQPDSELDSFVALLPGLFYGVNRLLEDSAPPLVSKDGPRRVSRKVVVALWALGSAGTADEVGRYLTTPDLVTTFRDWFVVSEENASPVVSKVKSKMWDEGYIAIEGGKDHIHLTEKGKAAFHQIIASAKRVIGATIGILNPKERRALLDYAQRMIDTAKKKPVGKELP